MKFKYLSFNIIIQHTLISLLVLANITLFTGCSDKPVAVSGEKAPEISNTDIHGNKLTLGMFKGNVVILYFWTDSCCGDSLRYIERYYRQNKDKGLTILAINKGNNREIVNSYTASNRLTFTMMLDEKDQIASLYGVFGLPTIFIVDRNGIIQKKIVGLISTPQLGKLVAQYLE